MILPILLGNFMTIQTNQYPLIFGPTVLPALTTYEFFTSSLMILFDLFLPFLLGHLIFSSPRELKTIYVAFLSLGVVYAFPIILELFLSPFLNKMIYGYHPHYFHLHVRYGGFRPMVFLGLGLAISMFISCGTISAAILAKAKVRIFNLDPRLLMAFLFMVLVGAKSLASILYAVALVPLTLVTKPRTQLRIAVIIATLVFCYPTLRLLDALPVDGLVSVAALIHPDRAKSLAYRFNEEVGLLDKVREKPAYGWGGYGRNLLFTKWGQGISTPDGYWIILLGSRGLVGAYGTFALLLWPIITAYRAIGRIRSKRQQLYLSGLSLIVVFSVLDFIPNGLFTKLPIFLSGALYGASRGAMALARSGRTSRTSHEPDPAPLHGENAAPIVAKAG